MTGIVKNGRKRFGLTARGFMLYELLAAVAVIAILTAIAVPSALTVIKGLRMTRLDETAKQLYIAAQNNLTSLIASGNQAVLTDTHNGTVKQMSALPKALITQLEASGSARSDYSDNYYYIAADTAALKAKKNPLISEDSVGNSIGEGYYIIEYDALNGTVYSVFFADQPFAYSLKPSEYMSAESRERAARKRNDPPLGYYGSDSVSEIKVVATESFNATINSNTLSIEAKKSTHYTVTLSSDSTTVTLAFNVNETGYKEESGSFFTQSAPYGEVTLSLGTLKIDKDGSGTLVSAFNTGETVKCVVASMTMDAGGNTSVTPYRVERIYTLS